MNRDAGTMDYRMAFDAPVSTANGQGGTLLGWDERFQAFAAVKYLRGGETVIAARLRGVQPVVVTIRASAAARCVTPDWRMRDVRSGVVYNIRTIIPSDDRASFELTCESGVTV